MKKLAICFLVLLLCLSFSACSAAEEPKPQTEPAADYAVYSIFYHANGGELSPYNPVAYNSFTPSFTLIAPEREGYRFLGWSLNEDGSDPVLAPEVAKGTTGNLHYYAVWGKLLFVLIDSSNPSFYTITPISGPVCAGEVYTVHIATAEPVSSLQWYFIGGVEQMPDSCVYDEELGVFVVKFTLTKSIRIMVI